MPDQDNSSRGESRFSREEVRDHLIKTWLQRPEKHRNQYAAERFAQQASEDFDFPSERPRMIVIRGWIRPHVIPVEERRESRFGRWLNRPWYERSLWPVRLAGVAFLAYAAFKIFSNLLAGHWAVTVVWVPVSGVAVMVLLILWVPRDRNR